jgi:hypothetical protein
MAKSLPVLLPGAGSGRLRPGNAEKGLMIRFRPRIGRLRRSRFAVSERPSTGIADEQAQTEERTMRRGHLLLALLAAFAFISMGFAHAETADSIMGNKKANSMPKRVEPIRPRLNPNAPINRPRLACVPYACPNGRIRTCRVVQYQGKRLCYCGSPCRSRHDGGTSPRDAGKSGPRAWAETATPRSSITSSSRS